MEVCFVLHIKNPFPKIGKGFYNQNYFLRFASSAASSS